MVSDCAYSFPDLLIFKEFCRVCVGTVASALSLANIGLPYESSLVNVLK